MTSTTYDQREVAAASSFPSQREVAEMLRLTPGQVSRSRVPSIRGGERGRYYEPGVVLELAARYKRRSLNEIAADLLHLASERAPAQVDVVRDQIEQFFAGRTPPRIDKDRFLEEARRTLPPRLYEQIKYAYEHGEAPPAVQFVADTAPVAAADG